MIFVIAAREIRSAFLSPIAWVMIGVIQIILGFMTAFNLQTYIEFIQAQQHLSKVPFGVTDYVVVPQYGFLAVMMVFAMPLITMRVFSDERRNKTLALLVSAPISMTEIVLGKYVGLLFIIIAMLAVYAIMPLSLLFISNLDFGLLASSMLGIFLFMATSAAIGLFISSLTSNPIIAAILTFFSLLFLWILSIAKGDSPTEFSLADLSLFQHLEAFQRGIFSSSDFIYYILFSLAFLVLAIRRLDSDRLQR
ncbi:hypothetical protein MNBD_GAMMA21-1919 [hydrothermal vent metagenome]|uniref:ABC-2 type transporter transmembrane domain-containing protein n=1 Tax=hydrothermal vent metagenome TaxID=652676 RepID=A0A3B0ZN84_9ZZZZ